MEYADIILPLAVDEPFTYAVPEALREAVQVGVRVVVPLGARKYYTGIVYRLHDEKPDGRRIRAIVSVSDDAPVVGEIQLKFWKWLADYYLCGIGEVMKAALPAALKSAGYTDDLRESYSAKTETHLALHPSLDSDEALNDALDTLHRAKSRQTALLRLAGLLRPEDAPPRPSYPKTRFIQGGYGSAAVLKALQDKGFVRSIEVEISRYDTSGNTADAAPLPDLTAPQRQALAEIHEHFNTNKTTLLHGVTGSGKTEIYIHLIAATLDAGRDALYLLPEIALTTQLIERLQRYFTGRVVVYHSRSGDNLRAECYRDVLKTDRSPMLVLGVRSSLLLPHHNLGLIVVDEEHETSYKQQDPAPRYHARDAAIVLGGMMPAAHVLLGSATPAIESYYNGESGKYGLVTLSERYGGAKLPAVVVVDTARAARRGEKISHFSRLLLGEIERVLAAGEQAILFQNRRGFSPYIECGACGAIPTCPNCNVSLTYHKQDGALVCHYCGHTIPRPTTCPACGAADLQTRGFGTEKIEEELVALFPQARIARLDLDATRSVRNFARIVSAFDAGRVDILVGTQMVTKGFDFDRVTLVGVLNADNLLNYPDFRASERGFQLMMQVAGRAGRRQTEGRVVIQTSQPDHPVLAQIRAGDYGAMFRSGLAERQRFGYPPYCRLVRFTLKHTDKAVLNEAAEAFDKAMRAIFGRRLLGPETPLIDKVRGEHLATFLLKIERDKSFAEAKSLTRKEIDRLLKHPGRASLTIVADIDPQ
jgi:primosomal protein N' (replication factor Y)